MKHKYDVVVVGAGPAGSIAAKTSAEKGLDVLLIEKRQEIGNPVRCAEGVSQAGIKKHIMPDKKWIAAEVKGSRIYAPDGTRVDISEERSGKEVGYVLERKVFDRVLAQEAALAGAEVLVKTSATGLRMENGLVRGIQARSFGEMVTIESKIVIGADGIESKVGRWAGIDTHLAPKNIETCAQFLMTNIEVSDYSEFYLGEKIAPSGYVWIFPKGQNSANVGIGILGSRSEKGRAIALLQEFVAKRMPRGRIIEIVVGGVPVSGPIERTIANGLMLVGDAARQSDPLTGGGIINAMDAGRIAGEVAFAAISKGDTSVKALEEYEKRWRATIGKNISRSLVVKNLFIRLKDEELNTLAHSLEGIDVRKMGLFGLLKTLFNANPKLLWELRTILK